MRRNSFVKTASITLGILLVISFICIVAMGASGIRWNRENTDDPQLSIMVGSAHLDLSFLSTIFNNITVHFPFSYGSLVTKQDAGEYAAIDVRSVDIRMEVGEVVVQADGAPGTLKLTYDCRNMRQHSFSHDLKDGVLSIRQQIDPGINGWGNNSHAILTLHVPREFLADYTVHSDVGTVSLREIQANLMKITTDVGEVELTDVTCADLSVRTSVGEQRLTRIHCDQIDLHSDTGALRAQVESQRPQLKVESNIGEVRLTLPATAAFAYDLKSSIGEINLPNHSSLVKTYSRTGMGDRTEQGTVNLAGGQTGGSITVTSDIGEIRLLMQ